MKIIILTLLILTKYQLTIETSNSDYDMPRLISKYNLEAKIESEYNEAIEKATEHYNIKHELAKNIYDICYGIGIDYYIFLELIFTESSFNPNAISSSDAVGYCQIKNIVVKDIGMALDRYKPSENILIGAYYFKSLLDDYGLDIYEALIFYNTGTRKDLRSSGERYANKILKNKIEK